MGPVTLTTTDASGGATHSAVCPMDWRTCPFNVGIGVVVSGTVSVTVEHTFDGVTWFPNANVNAATSNTDTNYMFPVLQIRVTQNSGSGHTTTTVLQSGPVR